MPLSDYFAGMNFCKRTIEEGFCQMDIPKEEGKKGNTALEKIEQLCQEIDMPKEAAKAVLSYAAQLNKEELQASMDKLFDKETWEEGRRELKEALGEDPKGFGMLYCMLQCAVTADEHYKKKGISHEIYTETMKCFSRFVKEYKESFGDYGFDRDFWTPRQLSGLIYRIGELEYELLEKDGKGLVDIHIPSDAELERGALSLSLREAAAFLKEKYPTYAEADIVCHSWLLSPTLKEVLPAKSRILIFQEFFDLTETEQDCGFMEWIFKRTDLPLEELPENTSLQRNLKKYLQSGGKVRDAKGILKQEYRR